MNREEIEKTLISKFNPILIEVIDDSAKHHGHRGTNHTENTHFNLVIVSDAFKNINLVQRHRAINNCLKEAFSKTLHALKITAKSPEEWTNQ